jgi:signal transduction histidine kinase
VDQPWRVGWRDVAVPAVLLAFGAAELATLGTQGWLAAFGLEALAAVILVFRRTLPLVAVPCSAIALMAIPLTGTRMEDAATPIFFYILGMYTLGRYPQVRSGLVGLGLTLGLIFVDFQFDPSSNDWTDVVFILSLAVPPYVFGRISRKLAMQSELLARQSQQLRDQAVREERDRIARELHDVIAHSVSAMVVQTAAAQDLVASHPDRAALDPPGGRRHRASRPGGNGPTIAPDPRRRRRAGSAAGTRPGGPARVGRGTSGKRAADRR